jgi:rhodanese-related sulfurtransferase
MKRKWVVWAVVAVVLVGAAYLGLKPSSAPKGVVNVDTAKVEKLITDSKIRIVDVRTAGEFEIGHLSGAINAPVDEIQTLAAGWDRAQPLLVYCATGERSAEAVQQLQSMGFQTIYHFSAGLIAWQGKLDKGTAGTVAQAPAVQTNGIPVMYELYTDT